MTHWSDNSVDGVGCCGACRGTGWLTINFHPAAQKPPYRDACWTCHGTGHSSHLLMLDCPLTKG